MLGTGLLIIRGKLQALEPTIPDWVASMHSTLASVARVSLMARRRGLLARKDTGSGKSLKSTNGMQANLHGPKQKVFWKSGAF